MIKWADTKGKGYNRQRSPENPTTAIKGMIDAEEDATTHKKGSVNI